MYKYTKIETVFKRDVEGTKKLIEGEYRDKSVEYLKDNLWIGTEKIDGTNIGVVWDGYNVTFQGRTEKASIPPFLMEYLENTFKNPETEQIFEQLFGEKQVVLFGEGYGNKIQSGGKYCKDNKFILFDVYIPQADLWLERDSIEEIAKALGIDCVPIVFKGTIEEGVKFVKQKPKSTIGTANMEGIVCKPAVDLLSRTNKRIIVKIKVKDFC